ncbi:MAG: hypothetical protein FJ315_00410, partial [SAR202 cluster bacterium]|nr:hypothetical protein [SAR202 cluster bacterium]
MPDPTTRPAERARTPVIPAEAGIQNAPHRRSPALAALVLECSRGRAMPDTAFELPLFPLPTVLFPGISMELNVRYPGQHAMLKEAVDRGSRLGIVLPKNVVPADDPVPWHSVGTLSSVADVRPSRGPRVFFSVLGEARFRVLEVLQR